MSKNVGLVRIPYEYILDNNISPEDLRGRLLLPEGVTVYKVHEDFYRQVFNFMLISEAPVTGVTYPTELGQLAEDAEFSYEGNYIKVGERA